MMREKLEAALVVYEATRKNYHDSDLMRSQAGYDLSKRVRAAIDQDVDYDVDSPGCGGDLLEVLEVWIDDYLHKHTEHKSSGQMAYEIAEHVKREGYRIPAPDQDVDSDVDSLGDLPRWFCDDCMMREMTEAEGNAHHASTGHSVSSK